MGIGNVIQPLPDDAPQPPFIIRKAVEPIVVASKKLYQTDPKGLLELVVTVLFLITSIFIRNWGFYLVFALWILVYSNAQEAGYQLYLKIKKHKKWATNKTTKKP